MGDGWDFDLMVEEFCRLTILEPVVGNRSNKVGRTEDQINVQFAFEDFCDPPLVMNLSLEAKRSEFVEDLWIATGLNKDVDVLCGPPQPGVGVDRKTSRNHEREFGIFENLQNFCVEGMSREIGRASCRERV